MIQFTVKNDTIHSLGEVEYLGVPYDRIKSGEVTTLPPNYDGWFPFMRMCYSLGDLGIVSGLFGALKQKYPSMKIAMPSKDYIQDFFKSSLSQWEYSPDHPALGNLDIIYENNPHIDYYFNKGEFDVIFTDHDRSYTSLSHDGEKVVSCDEPLTEQILRRFGFSDEEIERIDSKPKLYFSPEEVKAYDKIIHKYMGDEPYGCLLFASRIPHLKGRWSFDHHLIEGSKEYHNKPVFYFSEFNLDQTEWSKRFPNSFNFADLDLTLREQIYIKSKALFNLSYQAGITDASSGMGTQSIILCPYKSIRENCIRDSRYIYSDGTSKTI